MNERVHWHQWHENCEFTSTKTQTPLASARTVCDLINSVFWLFLCVLSPEPRDVSAEAVAAKPSQTCVSRKQQKEDRKADIHLKPRSLHTHSSHERPHSLADLKMYKDTKILVAKFLEHSSCSLPPEVQQVVNNIKCVIKSDEKHMEEAIFSANVIDQVTALNTMIQPIIVQIRKGKTHCILKETYYALFHKLESSQVS